MKKLLFFPIALALVAPLALGATNLTDRANAQAPATTSETASPVSGLTKDWYRYTAKDGSYSALFPGQPEETVESDSSVQVTYEDRANNRAYLTQFGKLNANPNQNEIEDAFDAAVASVTEDDSTVLEQQKISRQGVPGREVIVRSKDGMVMKMQMFIDTKVPAMYMVAVAAEKGNLDFPEAQAFLDSVSLK
jgi:hypothetical protein